MKTMLCKNAYLIRITWVRVRIPRKCKGKKIKNKSKGCGFILMCVDTRGSCKALGENEFDTVGLAELKRRVSLKAN